MDAAFVSFRQLVMNEPAPPTPSPAPFVAADIHRPICVRYQAHVYGNDGVCIYCQGHRPPR